MDFYVHDAKLCIEVDGELHDAEHDRKRDRLLLSRGIRTLRFKQDDVLQDVLACFLTIQNEVNLRVGQK
jgi:very-short-patch-repair endonuclease